MDYFELIKTIGAFVGLVTGAFVFYDRFNKGRPVATLTFKEEGTRKLACIRVSNPTPYDVMIIDTLVSPSIYFLTDDFEIKNLVRGAAGKGISFILKSHDSREVLIAPLFKDGVALELTKPGAVNFWIYWRRGNATWLKMPPVPVCTSTEILRKFGLEEVIG